MNESSLYSNISFAVVIPFYNHHLNVIECVKSIINEIEDNGSIILVNDGSTHSEICIIKNKFINQKNIKILNHSHNKGVSESRNTAIDWCRGNDIEIVIMIDSDTIIEENCIYEHLHIHKNKKNISILGGAVYGIHNNLISKIDGIVSWVHSIPHKKFHEVKRPYHLPTNNMSFKLKDFATSKQVFPRILKTGEDAYFIKEAQNRNINIFFSPKPKIYHKDRIIFKDLIKHQYEWGHHQYFILTRWKSFKYSFNLNFRILFFCFFLLVSPIYILLGTILNLYPWLKFKPYYLIYSPLIFLLWIIKLIAFFDAIIRPYKNSNKIKC